jgi:hypothetical protein
MNYRVLKIGLINKDKVKTLTASSSFFGKTIANSYFREVIGFKTKIEEES